MSKATANTMDCEKYSEEIAYGFEKSPAIENKIENNNHDGDGSDIVIGKLPERTLKSTTKAEIATSILNQQRAVSSLKIPSTNSHTDTSTTTSSTKEDKEIIQDSMLKRASNTIKVFPTVKDALNDSKPVSSPQCMEPTMMRVNGFRCDSPTQASSVASSTRMIQIAPKPKQYEFKHVADANTNYNNNSHYGQPYIAIAPYPQTVVQSQHDAAAAAAALSVAAYSDAIVMQHSDKAKKKFTGDHMPSNFSVNPVLQSTEYKPEHAAHRNRPFSAQVDATRNVGGYQPVHSYIVAQHNAASSAAAQHLNWKTNTNQTAKRTEGKTDEAFPEIIEIIDDTAQKAQMFDNCTATMARQFAGSEAASAGLQESQRGNQRNHEIQCWNDQISNDKKRGLPEKNDNHTQKQPAQKRQAPTISDAQNQTKHGDRSIATTNRSMNANTFASSVNNIHVPVPQPRDSLMREVNVNDAMNIALDTAILSDATQYPQVRNFSGRRVDSPMTYLVRQLLGQVEILGDEPAVVLAPPLVRDASNKIRLVINKLMEIIAMNARKDSGDKIRELESRIDALQKSNFASDRDKVVGDAYHRNNFLALKNFAEEKCKQLADRDKQIEYLRMKLQSQETDVEDATIRKAKTSQSTQSYEERTNATIRQLISRLDESMTTIQGQQKEIQVLKAIIEQDKNSLHGKRNMIPFLKETFGLHDGAVTTQNNDAAENQEIMLLKTEMEELQSTLATERRQHEISLKAYMRAAVHALKIQHGDMD
jgi:hypothetical protein